MPVPLYKSPIFMEDMWSYLRDPSTQPPDPGRVDREAEDFMRMVMAMLGSRGYLDYKKKLGNKPKKSTTQPPPAPTMTPTPGIHTDPVGAADRIIGGY